jgi:molybdopterin molybdotransferase
MHEIVLTFEQACRSVEQHATAIHPPATRSLPLLDSVGRVLAAPINADRDFPPFARATRDGYAVRADDLARVPVRLEVVGEIRAGMDPSLITCELKSGEAAEIMTGAPVPAGADAVVMIEYTARDEDFVDFKRGVQKGENIVPQGSEARSGQLLLDAGHRIDAPAVALAASVGKTEVLVYRRPRVAVLATGDEIVDIHRAPGATQIRNSNSYSLAAQVRAAGAEPVVLPIAPDDYNHLRDLIAKGLTADLLLLSGGVSKGKYDLVEQVLHKLGAEFFFNGAQIQPGRPTVFGRCCEKFFFGLPGNPVSTMVTFELFVRPLLNALCGASPTPMMFVQARLKSGIKTKTGLTRFLPARLSGEFAGVQVELMSWQGSGDMVTVANSNCYLVVPPDRERIPADEIVSVLLR